MRKKIIIFFITAFCLGSVIMVPKMYGQAGGITAEMNLSVFNPDQAFITLAPEFVKFRYFVADDIAVRLTTWGSFSSDQQEDRESTVNSSYFAARPGVEYHLVPGAGEFSAYVGLEFIFDQTHRSYDTNVGMPVTGATGVNNIRNFHNRGYRSLGGALVGGADVYMGGNFYFGTEFGLAYTHDTHNEVEYGDELLLEESVTSSIRIDLTRALRVGFLIN